MSFFHFLDRVKNDIGGAVKGAENTVSNVGNAGLHFLNNAENSASNVARQVGTATLNDVRNTGNSTLSFLGNAADKVYNTPAIQVAPALQGKNAAGQSNATPFSLHDLVGAIPGAVRDTLAPAASEGVKDIGNVAKLAVDATPLSKIPGLKDRTDQSTANLDKSINDAMKKAGVQDHGIATQIAKAVPKILEFGAGGEAAGLAEGAVGGLVKSGLGARSLSTLNDIADLNPALARTLVTTVTNPTADRGIIESLMNPRAAGAGAKLLETGARAVAGGTAFTVANDAPSGKSASDIIKQVPQNIGGDFALRTGTELASKAAPLIQDFISHAKSEGVSDGIVNKLQTIRDAYQNHPISNEGGYIRIPGGASDNTVKKVFTQQSDANSLYHGTESDNALGILKSGKIDQFQSDVAPAVSMSRSRNAGVKLSPGLGKPVRFVVDENKLTQQVGKTTPFVDGQLSRSKDPSYYEAEQRSTKGAVPLSSVKRIELNDTVSPADEKQIRQLAQEKGIPVVSTKNPSEMRSVLSPGDHPSDIVRNMNRPANEANTSAVRDATLAGQREGERLDNPQKLQIAKDYTDNRLPANATPDTTVPVYRAAEPGKPIGAGDHISLNEAGAAKYTQRTKGLEVTQEQVPLRDLVGSGGTKNEFIYAPKDTPPPTNLDEFNKMLDAGVRPEVKAASAKAATEVADNAAKAPTMDEIFGKDTATPKRISPALKQELAVSHPADSQEVMKAIAQHQTDVKSRVNLVDMVRSPEHVMQKIGLGDEYHTLREAHTNMQNELRPELQRVTDWSHRVSKEDNQKIFKWLDGQQVQLSPEAHQVATEVKTYLAGWAQRLGIPEDKMISSYITRIFEKDFINKGFDEDLAKLIQEKVPGAAYNPFLTKRLGKQGYKEDTWAALDAYIKRGLRTAHMNPALEQISKKADKLELSQYNYVKKYIDRVNMRPTDIDILSDNFLKSIIGYKLGDRPTAAISRTIRRMVYRGTLGLNPGSALKNLTQGANTYAELGERWTLSGYTQTVKALFGAGSRATKIPGGEIVSGAQKSMMQELKDAGVLTDTYIGDRTQTAAKKAGERLDKVLFSFFDMAEKVNRGAAYFGAKSKALNQGKTEAEAIDYAKSIVRKTQFQFGAIDTPPVLQGDAVKLLAQFQSFNVKQAEFLGQKIKDKEYAGLVRWLGASLFMVGAVGKTLGMKPTDLIPFSQILSGQNKIGDTPATKVIGAIGGAITNAPNKYGKVPTNLKERLAPIGSALIPFIPAGTQAKKTIQGLQAYTQGESTTASGRTRFTVEPGLANLIKSATLGQYSTSGGQQYVASLGASKSSSSSGSRGASSGSSYSRSAVPTTGTSTRTGRGRTSVKKLRTSTRKGGVRLRRTSNSGRISTRKITSHRTRKTRSVKIT